MNPTLQKAYEKYFEILEDYFGLHYKQMRNKRERFWKATARGRKVYDEKLATSVCDTLFQELRSIDWLAINNEIQQMKGTKALFQCPVLATENLIKRTSMYADTVVFSGLLPHISEFREIYSKLDSSGALPAPMARITLALNAALRLLDMKEIFLADLNRPIATIASPLIVYNDNLANSYSELQKHDSLELCSYVFGKKFSSHGEFNEYILKQKNLETLIKCIQKPEFFESPGGMTLEKYFATAIETESKLLHPHIHQYHDKTEILLWTVRHALVKALGGSTSQLIDCKILDAEPTTSDMKRWHLLKWRFMKDCRAFSRKIGIEGISVDSLVLTALQLDNFRWLGNVPLHGIIKMREEGELQNIRDILSREIENIKSVSDEDFVKVVAQVKHNLEEAFNRHRTQVKRLDETFRKKYDFDVASLLVTGSLGVVSALFPPLAMLTGVIGGGSITKIIHDVLEERSKRAELRRKPMGLLFQAYEDSN